MKENKFNEFNEEDDENSENSSSTRKGISRSKFLKNMAAGSAGMLLPAILTANSGEIPAIKIAKKNSRTTDQKPNIVIIFDDQLRRDALGVFGGGFNFTTPHLDRLSSQGTNFRNSISTCPLCTPFRGMLMTGRYPTHSGVIFNFVETSPEQNPNCLANVFDEAGYETGFIGKWHLASGYRVGDGLYKFNPEAEKEYKETHPNHNFVPPGPERLGFKFWQAYNFENNYKNYWYYEDTPKKIFSHKYETDTQLYDNGIDPYQMKNIVHDEDAFLTLQDLRQRLKVLLAQANDDFRPGNEYDKWFNNDRTLKRTGLGPVKS